MKIIIFAALLLPACATSKIQKAKDEGFADGAHGQMLRDADQIETLQGANKSLHLALTQCNARLTKCQDGRDCK